MSSLIEDRRDLGRRDHILGAAVTLTRFVSMSLGACLMAQKAQITLGRRMYLPVIAIECSFAFSTACNI